MFSAFFLWGNAEFTGVCVCVRVCARFVCHISACLRFMQIGSREWVGGGVREGQLHGKLLVLIQHVEQRRTFQ